MNINNANNPNYIPAYIETTRYGVGGPNNTRLTMQEITERKLRREVGSRVDASGSLMAQHVAQINMMRMNGTIQGSAMRNANISTPAAEAMRNQRIDVIRDIMSNEEEGTLRMSVLQQMLEQALQPLQSLAGANNNPNGTQQWWA
ncbi:MAG: hypothetical protein FWB74_07835 [Defluviitaleaceae bacterium]|nr:hypothetical protein [Defluviitaleaceae bacterium]